MGNPLRPLSRRLRDRRTFLFGAGACGISAITSRLLLAAEPAGPARAASAPGDKRQIKQGKFAKLNDEKVAQRVAEEARRSPWRPLPANQEQGVVCFETRGTDMRVQIRGKWRGGPEEPEVGLSGNPNKAGPNGLPHMCLLFIWRWLPLGDSAFQELVEYATSDEYDFVQPQSGIIQMKLTLKANDFPGRFADNTSAAEFLSEPVQQ